jgi:predicted kinase
MLTSRKQGCAPLIHPVYWDQSTKKSIPDEEERMPATHTDVQVVLICGNYGSGKSSLARKQFGTRKRINRKEIRRFLTTMTSHGESWSATDYTPEEESIVKHIELSILRYYLERKEPLVIDNSSVTRKSRAVYIREARAQGASISCIFVQVPVTELLERNRARDADERVPETVISQLYAKTELPERDEGFQRVTIVRG